MKTFYKTLIVVLFALLILFCVIQDWESMYEKINGSDYYNSNIVTQNEYKNIIQGKKHIPFNMTINFNNYPLVKDVSANKYYYSLIENNKNSYNPKIKINSQTKNLKIAILNEKISNENIINNKEISFIVYSDEFYEPCTLVLTTLPIISVYSGRDNKEMDVKDLYLFDNRENAQIREIKERVRIELRGDTSRYLKKSPYKMTMGSKISPGNRIVKKAISLLGSKEHSVWHLHPNCTDYLQIRNALSFDIWKNAATDTPSLKMESYVKYQFIELFVNQEYVGLYTLGYPVNAELLKLTENDSLFKKARPLLYGMDNEQRAKKEFLIKHGKNFLPIENYYDYSDGKKDVSEIYSTIDILNYIDMWLFINLVQGDSNLFHNFYIVSKKQLNENRFKYYMLPWDLDATWGIKFVAKDGKIFNKNDFNRNIYYEDFFIKNKMYNYNVINSLISANDEETKKLVKKRYFYLRKKGWSDKEILRLINEYEKLLLESGAYKRNKRMWSDGCYCLEGEDIEDFEQFKKYVFKRTKSFDSYIQNL